MARNATRQQTSHRACTPVAAATWKSHLHVPLLIIGILLLAVGSGSLADPIKYPLGDIPLAPEVYQKLLKVRPMDQMTMLEGVLPSSYDARSESIVTSAKNQGSCGSCWAFATVGAMESHLLRQLGVGPQDLSEQQQVSCNRAMAGCSGGSATALRYWEGSPSPDKGPLAESVFPYTANDSTTCNEPLSEQMPYRVTNFHTVPVTTLDFKASLYEQGPSYWRYNVYSDFYTFWGTNSPGSVYVNKGGTFQGGHAVLLIGWDDNKQAFLCKNSWGSGGPNGDGTFWIAYGGHQIDLGFGMSNFGLVALTGCVRDSDCSDDVYCNGAEQCVAGACQAGTPVSCNDGLWCTGVERCDEYNQACISVDPPCNENTETCIEDGDYCSPLTCPNDVCEAGEDCHNCPDDCISGSGGGTEAACFKGIADGSCHPIKETAACVDCAPGYCCGDGVCAGGENASNCELDCGGAPTAEDCSNNLDDDGDGQTDCDDPDCAGTSGCPTCALKKEACDSNSDCCSGRCSLSKGTCL